MYLLKPVPVCSIICMLLLTPAFISGTSETPRPAISRNSITPVEEVEKKVKVSASLTLLEQSHALYDSMQLRRTGLTKKAFEYAWKGYHYMRRRGLLKNPDIISICDFSQSSRRRRLYIIDVKEKRLLINTYVAHGRNSGKEYARSFSNRMESHKSSLGFYVTRGTYYGGHGLSLEIDGIERGFNDKAQDRRIVIHGSQYVGSKFIRNNPFNGRSFGCPAVPARVNKEIIQTIKNGSCLFIYHPSKNYLSQSKILNG